MSRPPLSDLELARLESPGTPDAQLVVQLAQRTLDELAMQPPISHEIAASLRDIIKIDEALIPWAGCLVPGDDGLVMKLRITDGRRRKRFTAFHEVNHTYLPGFSTLTQYRCEPEVPLDPTQVRDPDLEVLCDIGAAELLFPRAAFCADLIGNTATFDLVEELAGHYDASLEATGHRLVALYPRPSLLIAFEPARKPSAPNAKPVLRVKWAHPNGDWPYVPRHKSVPDDSVFGHALQGEPVDEIASLGALTNPMINRVRVSARLYPYTDARGDQHMRVLALITPARPLGTSRGW